TVPLDWAEESLTLTRRIYAELPTDGRLSEDYYERHHPLAIERITIAGLRLGRLLNTLLSD
ncbi:MAG TPA: S1/P1 nuclease, partial [Candidatus Glassbacteria bacterium]|nr:S1/P1 nuclease [Candidatus Glassbacteria bacterium]